MFKMKRKLGIKFFRSAGILAILAAFSSIAFAQANTNSESNSNSAAVKSAEAEPTPIPVSEIYTLADETGKRLETIQTAAEKSDAGSKIKSELANFSEEVNEREAETTELLSARPSLETLRIVDQDWQSMAKNIPAWNSELKSQISQYDSYIKELQTLYKLWTLTLNSHSNGVSEDESGQISDVKVPAVIINKIEFELNSIEKTQKLVEQKRGELLSVQNAVGNLETKIERVLASIKTLREEALGQLFVRDSPAIWEAPKTTDSAASIAQETGESLIDQANSLADYFRMNSQRFIAHGVLFLIFVISLFKLRRHLRPWTDIEPKFERAFTVFQLPFASALIISVLLSGWFYPQAPRVLSAILGALALIPGAFFLRKLIARPLFPILNAFVILYFVDQMRAVVASLPIVARIVFSLEIIGAILFLVWLLRSKRLSQKIPVSHHHFFELVKRSVPVLTLVLIIALAANIFGYVSFSNLLGNGIFGSFFAALILYAALQIVESLMIFAIRTRPLSTLRIIAVHGETVEQKLFKIFQWSAIFLWIYSTLNQFSVRQTIFDYIKEIFSAQLMIGSISISLNDLLIFAITIWLSFAISKLIRFILEEDIYPRVNLAGGVPYAISTMLHYALLVVGFILAIAALGIDLTKFTILAGAFGVGLGFGLQTIVNNFVSGIILLFERPVKVNDFVQIGEHQGELKTIGLRASVLRTLVGSEVIVPNGQLISEEVTNWTFSDRQRRIEVDFGVAYGTDPRKVIELVTASAAENESVLTEPPPRTLFLGFGDSALNFQLRAWTDDADNWVVVRSELTLAIHDVLGENNIEIPFPQRVVHLRRTDGAIEETPKKKPK